MALVKKYHWFVRCMHGFLGLYFISMLCLGLWMVNMEASQEKWNYYAFHKSFGVLILLFLFIRILARALSNSPKSFYKDGSVLNILEKYLYFVFYFVMFVIPLSGYLMSNASGKEVFMFGYAMPSFTNTNIGFAKFCYFIHVYGSYFLIALISVHVVSITYRIVIKKHNILQRMI